MFYTSSDLMYNLNKIFLVYKITHMSAIRPSSAKVTIVFQFTQNILKIIEALSFQLFFIWTLQNTKMYELFIVWAPGLTVQAKSIYHHVLLSEGERIVTETQVGNLGPSLHSCCRNCFSVSHRPLGTKDNKVPEHRVWIWDSGCRWEGACFVICNLCTQYIAYHTDTE